MEIKSSGPPPAAAADAPTLSLNIPHFPDALHPSSILDYASVALPFLDEKKRNDPGSYIDYDAHVSACIACLDRKYGGVAWNACVDGSGVGDIVYLLKLSFMCLDQRRGPVIAERLLAQQKHLKTQRAEEDDKDKHKDRALVSDDKRPSTRDILAARARGILRYWYDSAPENPLSGIHFTPALSAELEVDCAAASYGMMNPGEHTLLELTARLMHMMRLHLKVMSRFETEEKVPPLLKEEEQLKLWARDQGRFQPTPAFLNRVKDLHYTLTWPLGARLQHQRTSMGGAVRAGDAAEQIWRGALIALKVSGPDIDAMMKPVREDVTNGMYRDEDHFLYPVYLFRMFCDAFTTEMRKDFAASYFYTTDQFCDPKVCKDLHETDAMVKPTRKYRPRILVGAGRFVVLHDQKIWPCRGLIHALVLWMHLVKDKFGCMIETMRQLPRAFCGVQLRG